MLLVAVITPAATIFQRLKKSHMKEKVNDVRFWLLIVAVLTFIFSTQLVAEMPIEAKEITNKSLIMGLSIDSIFAGFVVIFFATMLVMVQQHFKQNQK